MQKGLENQGKKIPENVFPKIIKKKIGGNRAKRCSSKLGIRTRVQRREKEGRGVLETSAVLRGGGKSYARRKKPTAGTTRAKRTGRG